MNASRSSVFEAIKAAGPTEADSVARLAALAKFLDSAFVIPGTNRRFGMDSVIGLVPGIGDAISAALASYIIWEARQLGLPRWKIARMVSNVAIDTAIGAIPLAGDVFDVFFKANQRNLRIIHDHVGKKHGGNNHGGKNHGGKHGPREIDGTATRLD